MSTAVQATDTLPQVNGHLTLGVKPGRSWLVSVPRKTHLSVPLPHHADNERPEHSRGRPVLQTN